MATYNITPSQTIVPVSASAIFNGRVPCVVEAVVDFGTPTLPTNVTALSGTSGTVIDCINIPAGFVVLGTSLEVLRADTAGNSGTLQVKIGSTSEGSAVTVAATGFSATAGSYTPVVPSGTATFATLTVGTGTINAVVRLVVALLDVRAKVGTGVAIGTWTNPAGQTTVWTQDPISNYTASPLVYVT